MIKRDLLLSMTMVHPVLCQAKHVHCLAHRCNCHMRILKATLVNNK